MKKKFLAAILVASMGMSLAACGSSDSSDTNSDADSAQASESQDDSSNGESEKLSGTLTVYMPSPTDLNTAYIEGFEEKTGVKVELFEGTTGEIQARLEAEKDNPVADVVVLASWSDGLSMKESGQIMSYPEAENADKLYDGWVDEDNMLFGTSASALGVIYNTTLIDSLDADWSELADAKYKDMIAIPDPEKRMERIQLKGEITSPINVTKSCRFAPRCMYAKPECFEKEPQLEEIEKDHFVKCHFVREINGL